MEPSPPARCGTEAEARARLGQRCVIVGSYAQVDLGGKKAGGPTRPWPVVALDGGGHVALESPWDEARRPCADDLARWRGRRVAATGLLHASPPHVDPARRANRALLTLSPVEHLVDAPEPG